MTAQRMCWTTAAMVTLALPGCSTERVARALSPAETESFVRAFVDTLRSGTIEAAVQRLSPTLTALPTVADSLRSLQRQLSALGGIDSLRLVSGAVFYPRGSDVVRRDLLYEIFGPRADALASVSVLEELGWRGIDGLELRVIDKSVAANNAFLRNLGVPQVVLLGVIGVLVVFHLWAAVVVARTPMRQRWLWTAIALLGVGKLSVNWTTAAFGVQPVVVQLLSASGQRTGAIGPWVLAISFPLGAVLALARRRAALAVSRSGAPTPAPAQGQDSLPDA